MSKAERVHKVLLLMLVVVVTAVLFRSQGTWDINTWLRYGLNAYENGIIEGYAMNGGLYPPIPAILLWCCYHIADWLGIAPVYVLKFSLLLYLLATTAVFYVWTNKHLVATLIFYSAMLLSSVALAYLDIYFAPFVLLACYYLQRNQLRKFAIFFTIACMTKYPAVLVIPFFAIYLCAEYIHRHSFYQDVKKLFLQVLMPGCVMIGGLLFVFGLPMLGGLVRTVYTGWLSAFALNFNWIVTRVYLQNGWAESYPVWIVDPTMAMINPSPDLPRFMARLLYVFFVALACIVFTLRKKTFENLLMFSLLGSFTYFMFYTSAHENHLFFASLMGAALYCVNQKNVYLAIGVTLISSFNMMMFYGFSGNPQSMSYNAEMVSQSYSYWLDGPLLVAIGNVIYFFVLWFYVVADGWTEMRDRLGKK